MSAFSNVTLHAQFGCGKQALDLGPKHTSKFKTMLSLVIKRRNAIARALLRAVTRVRLTEHVKRTCSNLAAHRCLHSLHGDTNAWWMTP